MGPKEIARLINEDVNFNNGLEILAEEQRVPRWEDPGYADQNYGPNLTVRIAENEILGPESFPRLSQRVAFLTTLIKNVDLNNLYNLMRQIAQRNNGIEVTGKNGVVLNDGSTLPWTMASRRDDWQPPPVAILNGVVDAGRVISSSQLVWLTKGVAGKKPIQRSRLNPEEWRMAVRNNLASIDLADRKPEVFRGYFAIENESAKMVMMVSGKPGEGLYVLPFSIVIEDQPMDWVDAINLFSREPERYLGNVQIPAEKVAKVEERIRLLWRYYMEETKQGFYIDRSRLDPESTVEFFGAANNIEEFLNSYRTAAECLERFDQDGLFEDEEEKKLAKCPLARLKPVNPDETYNQEQLKMGQEVEKEHTHNLALAKMITKHHLDEVDPKKSKYYDKLAELEKQEKAEQAARDKAQGQL